MKKGTFGLTENGADDSACRIVDGSVQCCECGSPIFQPGKWRLRRSATAFLLTVYAAAVDELCCAAAVWLV